MNTILTKLRRLILAPRKTPSPVPPNSEVMNSTAVTTLNLTPASTVRLLHLLERTQEEELTCEETFDLLDEYVELAESEAEATAIMPLVKHHLDGCPDCHERYDALRRILQSDPNLN